MSAHSLWCPFLREALGVVDTSRCAFKALGVVDASDSFCLRTTSFEALVARFHRFSSLTAVFSVLLRGGGIIPPLILIVKEEEEGVLWT